MANHGSYSSLIDLTYTSCDAGGIHGHVHYDYSLIRQTSQELNNRGRGYSVESSVAVEIPFDLLN